VNVGDSSGELYWRDLDANQQITGEEARTFGGAQGSLANFVLQFDGVPEPHSLTILAAGALLATRRRRK